MGLKQAYEHFLNIDPNKIAEFLAKYLDLHLKKSSGITDKKIEVIMQEVIQVFRYVKSKDVFEEFFA